MVEYKALIITTYSIISFLSEDDYQRIAFPITSITSQNWAEQRTNSISICRRRKSMSTSKQSRGQRKDKGRVWDSGNQKLLHRKHIAKIEKWAEQVLETETLEGRLSDSEEEE